MWATWTLRLSHSDSMAWRPFSSLLSPSFSTPFTPSPPSPVLPASSLLVCCCCCCSWPPLSFAGRAQLGRGMKFISSHIAAGLSHGALLSSGARLPSRAAAGPNSLRTLQARQDCPASLSSCAHRLQALGQARARSLPPPPAMRARGLQGSCSPFSLPPRVLRDPPCPTWLLSPALGSFSGHPPAIAMRPKPIVWCP